MSDYKPRKIFSRIEHFLETNDIVVIHGARQTGKTTLLRIIIDKLKIKDQISDKNIAYFDLEDFSLLDLCNQGPREVIKYLEAKGASINTQHKFYLFIDEIQYLSHPSNFLKIFHDHFSQIKLFVSGSSSFDIKKKFRDSLVGRTVDFELFTLDFDEFLVFKGVRYNLWEKESFDIEAIDKEILPLFREYLIYGGYPKIVLEKNVKHKEIYLKQIIDTYVKKDIRDMANIRNVDRFNRFLIALSDQSGNLLNILELSNTVGLARQTIEEYLFILEKTYVIKLIRPFFTNVRSEITKMPKLFFEDTGMLNVLRLSTFIDKVDGRLFENGVYSLLRRNLLEDVIKYWRNKQKMELDFVLNLKKTIIPIEAKLSYPHKAKKNILSFLEKYKQEKGLAVSLQKPERSKNPDIEYIYPWQLYYRLRDLAPAFMLYP